MSGLIEHFLTRAWNRLQSAGGRSLCEAGLLLGYLFKDGVLTRHPIIIPEGLLTGHVCIWGITGKGKTSLIKLLQWQDVQSDHAQAVLDRHYDPYPFLLRAFSAQEIRRQMDLSGRLIPIDLSDKNVSAGINIAESVSEDQRFLQIAEIEELLSAQFGLTHLGVRYGERLRFALYVISVNGGTLLDLRPLLTDDAFLSRQLEAVENPEVLA
jgi:hypothetical protein